MGAPRASSQLEPNSPDSVHENILLFRVFYIAEAAVSIERALFG